MLTNPVARLVTIPTFSPFIYILIVIVLISFSILASKTFLSASTWFILEAISSIYPPLVVILAEINSNSSTFFLSTSLIYLTPATVALSSSALLRKGFIKPITIYLILVCIENQSKLRYFTSVYIWASF